MKHAAPTLQPRQMLPLFRRESSGDQAKVGVDGCRQSKLWTPCSTILGTRLFFALEV